MKVYDYKGFPNPARVRIALAEKGVIDQVEFITVDVPAGEHKSPEFLTRNPSGLVPVLELDDGTQISECTAITEYIDHRFPGVSLTGQDPKQRAIIHMMQRKVEKDLMDAVADYFHHATEGLGPAIEVYQNRDFGEKRREKAVQGMQYLDRVLQSRPYLAGDQFSMADITGFCGLLFAAFANIEMPSGVAALRDWQKRVGSRPSIQSA